MENKTKKDSVVNLVLNQIKRLKSTEQNFRRSASENVILSLFRGTKCAGDLEDQAQSYDGEKLAIEADVLMEELKSKDSELSLDTAKEKLLCLLKKRNEIIEVNLNVEELAKTIEVRQ